MTEVKTEQTAETAWACDHCEDHDCLGCPVYRAEVCGHGLPQED